MSEAVLAALQPLLANLQRVVIAPEETLRLVLVALLARGHLLLEDMPGVGKTTLARSLAQSLSLDFRRIQLTPDLLPSDLLGSSVYNPKTGEFRFHQGPVFSEVLLADELNRATPRSQSALLEAMQERQVSADGVSYPLPDVFLVIATQNPIELQGTFPLPEAQKDRFALATGIGYPDRQGQVSMLQSRLHGDPIDELKPVLGRAELQKMQAEVREVEVHPDLLDYLAQVGEQTRAHPDLMLGASPRALLSWLHCSQAAAYLAGRAFVRPRDLLELARPVLCHRLCLKPEVDIEGGQIGEILDAILDACPLPLQVE